MRMKNMLLALLGIQATIEQPSFHEPQWPKSGDDWVPKPAKHRKQAKRTSNKTLRLSRKRERQGRRINRVKAWK